MSSGAIGAASLIGSPPVNDAPGGSTQASFLPASEARGEGNHPEGGGGVSRAVYPSTMLCMVPLPIASRQGGILLRQPDQHERGADQDCANEIGRAEAL